MMADTQTIHGLDDVLAKLKALPPEIVSKRGGPVRKALRKGAMVIVNEWKAQVQRVIDEPNVNAEPEQSTGLLKSSIGATLDSKPQRHGANERYVVRPRNRKYPNTGKHVVTTAQVARLLEYGTEKMAAHPWAVPGYMASRQRALDTVVRELNLGIDLIVKKLSKQRLA